jgi:hypothetical protein
MLRKTLPNGNQKFVSMLRKFIAKISKRKSIFEKYRLERRKRDTKIVR